VAESDTSQGPTLPLKGGCLCGGVQFEVTAPPTGGSYCHCTRCQRRTGTAASPGVSLAAGSLRIVEGEHLVRAWDPGDGWLKLFCSNCGGQLFSRHPTQEDLYSVRMSAFDEDPGVRPQYRQYVASAAAWEPIPDDGLPRYPGPRPDGD
jgi:hypothetical protein